MTHAYVQLQHRVKYYIKKHDHGLNGLGSQHSGAQVALSKQTNGLHSHFSGSWISKDVFVRGWERQGCQIHPF